MSAVMKTYVVGAHKNHLNAVILFSIYNIAYDRFTGEKGKIIPYLLCCKGLELCERCLVCMINPVPRNSYID